MKQEHIDRINVLAKKKKTVGLSPEEILEQTKLRKAYIAEFRKDLIQTMNYVSVEDEDGTIRHMKDITKKKHIK